MQLESGCSRGLTLHVDKPLGFEMGYQDKKADYHCNYNHYLGDVPMFPINKPPVINPRLILCGSYIEDLD